jgi:metal-sulfur cluster biosynthetic enzyme
MSKTKELDILVNNVTEEILEKLYKVVDFHLSYSDLDLGFYRDYNDAHSYIMERVIEKLDSFDDGFKDYLEYE